MPAVNRGKARYNARILADTGRDVRQDMVLAGISSAGIEIMAPKARQLVIQVEALPMAAAAILKQEMLAKGGDAAIAGSIYLGSERTTDAILMGSLRTIQRMLDTLAMQPLPSLQALYHELSALLDTLQPSRPPAMVVRDAVFVWGTCTYIMGILNATPDSFSGDGLLQKADPVQTAVAQARAFTENGADILDIGGESTRPGAPQVSPQEEQARVVPIIRAIREQLDVPISIDTYNAETAAAALDAGADIINDVRALYEPGMVELAAERGVPVILMHNRLSASVQETETLGNRYLGTQYGNLIADVLRDLRTAVERAAQAGVSRERMIIDPGVGFGKTTAQNLALLNELNQFTALGLPLLLGASNKSFIGYTLDAPQGQRLMGTAAANAVGILHGADIIRVHDVREMAQLAKMCDAIARRS